MHPLEDLAALGRKVFSVKFSILGVPELALEFVDVQAVAANEVKNLGRLAMDELCSQFDAKFGSALRMGKDATAYSIAGFQHEDPYAGVCERTSGSESRGTGADDHNFGRGVHVSVASWSDEAY